MPSENKYEIRSQEVQEVLSTPPRFLTIWGNVFVVSVLVIGLVFLGRYRVAQTIKVPVQITEKHGKVGLIIGSDFDKQVKVNQQVKLHTNGDTLIEERIVEMFDTTINMSRKKFLILTGHTPNQFLVKSDPNERLNGEAEIQIGNISLFHLFFSK